MARKSEQIASLFAGIGFKVDKASYAAVDRAFSDIEKRVRGIQKLASSFNSGKGTADNFKGLAKYILEANTNLDSFNKNISKGIGPLSAYTMQMQSLAASLATIRGARLPSVPSNTGGGGRGGSSSNVVSSIIGGPAANLRQILPGLGAGWAVVNGVQTAREMVGNERALSALTGSPAGGKAEMAYLNKFAMEYGFDQRSMAEGYKKILASSTGTKLQGQKSKDIFEGVQLYGATLGLDPEAMKRSVNAISQMIGKGQIMSEELKGQLAENMPGAVQIFARALNVPVSQLFQMMKDGKVLSEDVLPKVAAEFRKVAEAGGAVEAYKTSSQAAQNRFKTQLDVTLQRLYENGGDKALSNFFGILEKIFKILTPILMLVTSVLNVATGMVNELLSVFSDLSDNTDSFREALQIVVELLGVGMVYAFVSARAAGMGFLKAMKVGFMSMARIISVAFFPLILLFDTMQALFTGNAGMLQVASEVGGVGSRRKTDQMMNWLRRQMGIAEVPIPGVPTDEKPKSVSDLPASQRAVIIPEQVNKAVDLIGNGAKNVLDQFTKDIFKARERSKGAVSNQHTYNVHINGANASAEEIAKAINNLSNKTMGTYRMEILA